MNQITTLHCSQIDRRRFLYGMGAIGIASGLTRTDLAEADNTSPKIKLGIIGCGGRGKFIGELAVEHGGYEIVSPGDYFQDQVNPLGEHFNVPAKGRFTGLHCYKRLLDAVAIMSDMAAGG